VIDYFNVAPKVFLNLDDLASTGLMQEGSRARWRLVVAGEAGAVERFIATARAGLQRGQRVETIADARPEVRSALERAGRFLGLAALVAVTLAAIAVAMAARQYSARHLQGVAVMRCLGAQQSTLVGIYLGELLLLGVLAGVIARSRFPPRASGPRCADWRSRWWCCWRLPRRRCWPCAGFPRCACCGVILERWNRARWQSCWPR